MTSKQFQLAQEPLGGVGQRFDSRVTLNSLWWVSNRSEIYVAQVLDFNNTRVTIRRVLPSVVHVASPLALWAEFAKYQPYTENAKPAFL